MDDAEQEFTFKLPFEADKIILDPDSWLLFENF